MQKQLIGYWTLTVLFCLAMAASGTMNLLRVEEMKQAMVALGYPEYLMTILGVAKIMGVVALLIPGTPVLKEWAYAGFTFDLLGASASHAFVGDPLAETVVPLVILGVAAASYGLRPGTRRIQLAGPPVGVGGVS
ncbi:MAG: DoxX family protein [Planctomycetota bacterium]